MDHLYFDHAATAPPLPEATLAFQEALRSAWANPGSLHQQGADAKRLLEESRAKLQSAFGASRYDITFVSSGTEANFLAIQGLARAIRPQFASTPTILVGGAEHPAAREAALALQEEGFRVDFIPVDSCGCITARALEPHLSESTALVTIQWANNEIGGLNPIAEISSLIKQKAPQAIFHTDAVQAAGKRKEWFDSLGADAISTAAHKIGGIRGCAALFLHKDLKLSPTPFFTGGGHEKGLRAGTENVMGAAAFAAAAQLRRQRLQSDSSCYFSRRSTLWKIIQNAWPTAILLGPQDDKRIQGSILSCAFPDTVAETLLHKLETHGISCGSGSACSSKGHTSSPILSAMGVSPELQNSVLRFSLDGAETEKELQQVGDALAQLKL